MGLFLCDLCQADLMCKDASPHTCKEEDIRKHIKQLEDQSKESDSKWISVLNAVRMTVQSAPSMEGEKVEVETQWLRRLWGASGGVWYEPMSADDFNERNFALYQIFMSVYDLFSPTRKYYNEVNGEWEHHTAKQALEEVFHTLERTHKKLFPKEEKEYALTVNDIIKQLMERI